LADLGDQKKFLQSKLQAAADTSETEARELVLLGDLVETKGKIERELVLLAKQAEVLSARAQSTCGECLL